jgi:hypothetical protein
MSLTIDRRPFDLLIKLVTPAGDGGSAETAATASLDLQYSKIFYLDCSGLSVDVSNKSYLFVDTLSGECLAYPGIPIHFIFKLKPTQAIVLSFGPNFTSIGQVLSPAYGHNTDPCLTLISDGENFSILSTSIGWQFT